MGTKPVFLRLRSAPVSGLNPSGFAGGVGESTSFTKEKREMKKWLVFLFAAGLVFCVAGSAPAVEFRASGEYMFTFDAYDGLNESLGLSAFMSHRDMVHNSNVPSGGGAPFVAVLHGTHSSAIQRVRVGMDFIISENLSAFYQIQVGAFTWGGPAGSGDGTGGAIGSRSANLTTRFAYLDWVIPNTSVKVRMGQQLFAVPSYTFIYSPVQANNATAVQVFANPTANISLTGAWVRADSGLRRGAVATASHVDDNLDLFFLAGNLNYDGFTVSPWGLIGLRGKDTSDAPGNNNGTDWLVGVGVDVTRFDPFRFTFDAMYTARDSSDRAWEVNAFYVAAGVEYKTDWGTPALKGWYASGNDDDDRNGTERAIYYAPFFSATSTYFLTGVGIYDSVTMLNYGPGGTWGVSLQWNGFSFADKLSHNASVTWIGGTNDRRSLTPGDGRIPAQYLTVKDSLVEVNLDSTYAIDRNLSAVLQLAYLIENFDGNVWGRHFGLPAGTKAQFSHAFLAALSFVYNF
jgi:hypothetical protein